MDSAFPNEPDSDSHAHIHNQLPICMLQSYLPILQSGSFRRNTCFYVPSPRNTTISIVGHEAEFDEAESARRRRRLRQTRRGLAAGATRGVSPLPAFFGPRYLCGTALTSHHTIIEIRCQEEAERLGKARDR